jgi:hypothetical protein
MGTLEYGPDQFEFDDDILAHVQLTVASKLRRGERFFMSWRLATFQGSGRHALWIDSGVPLRIRFNEADPQPIDQDRLNRLLATSLLPTGMNIDRPVPASPAPEPPAAAAATQASKKASREP